MKFEVTVPEDEMYEIKVRYTQVLTSQDEGRMQTISVNGTDYMVNFPYADTWTDISFGMFRLKAGVNTIEIKPQYGYASYDTITVDKADFPDLDVTPTLADKSATSETQSLMNYLCDVYGNGILSGQQEIYGGGNDGDYELEFDYIENLTGELPAIRGFDFMNYNPLYGWDDNTTERIIEWVNDRNGIATACWHINVPKDFSSYELGDSLDWTDCTYTPDSTDFDTNNAVIEGTKEYDYFMLAIDDLAQQLLYTTLTEDYGIHNIIWEYNSYDYTTSAQWYPGDDYVDIVGYDKYNTVYNRHDGLSSGPNVDAISSTFYSLVNLTNATKLVSMPENDTIPTIENMQIEKAGWLYFCPWYGEHILDSSKNDPDTLISIYQNDYCINLGDLPANLYSYESKKSSTNTTEPSEDTTEVTTTAVTTTEPTETTTTAETLSDTTVLTASVDSLEGNTLTVRYFDGGNKTLTYTITDEEAAKYPTDKSELINTTVLIEAPLIEGTDEYDFENPIHIDLQVTEYGYITAKDGDTLTITLDDSGKEYSFINTSSADYQHVGDYVMVAYNERTEEGLWYDLIKHGETTTTPIETEVTTVTTSDTSSTSESTSQTTTAPSLGDSTDVVLGDANEDGSVQANDVLLVKKYVLQMISDDEINLTNADVTQNGAVEANDLLLIKKYVLQMIDEF
jgi:mannan endo-1,4-beta-mannosidase